MSGLGASATSAMARAEDPPVEFFEARHRGGGMGKVVEAVGDVDKCRVEVNCKSCSKCGVVRDWRW